ncbi:hypothetical protein HRR83_005280 [Exophiala dermatitidis]|uniref:Alpha/beta hydrolase fold-3 domain-containing protein n=2 Tax=Exophiala dermatitidis TaxID=5970 RepID=H6C1S9_EXODN|nr:uncharacterized protein HMPREF1120_05832 [Exophiala dermatitidis NIH/UT8656]KAJ4512939.1 hypothetical protein HRR75_004706 [Exophiala dermatitidis]EHY57808.1 hypothetical protein HMPREF1120_05832 [Exophiala dermatitidis NIH/UT8656]KAJ4515975.1 hypothetical protein HRR74_005132 [Exophiala dermatitidis]KAJ4518619.1 hypothetical protein HRR73_004200 [Exophiala dermatitidis]KAJ4534130.1 hypothetical protein HRR76_006066 [Exophiala dermatitidis]
MTTPPTPGQAASTSIHQISWIDKLDLIPGLLSILGTAIYAAVTAPFRGEAGAYTFKQHVTHAMVRKMVTRLDTHQLQYVGEPFSKVYEKWYRSQGGKPDIVTLNSGRKAFWMGDHKTAKYIVVYYHGGGFSLDGDDTHFRFWHSVQKDLQDNNIPVAFLFLEYSLVPHATYPTQIIEAIEAVNYVTTELKRPASEILLAGDSAGGNMCLAVLSQIMHPSSQLPEVQLADGDKLKGLVLVAPWVSFRTDWPSVKRNEPKDIVCEYGGRKWSRDYLGGKETSPFAEALLAPADWWKDSKVEQLLVVAGADEILIDPINQWVDKFKSVNPDTTTYVVGAHEGHIAPIFNLRFGDTTETEQGKAIKSWMKAKL